MQGKAKQVTQSVRQEAQTQPLLLIKILLLPESESHGLLSPPLLHAYACRAFAAQRPNQLNPAIFTTRYPARTQSAAPGRASRLRR
jgi:hypothetical protein